MPWPDRIHNFSLQRIAEDSGEPEGGPLTVGVVYGQIENIAGGEVVHGVNTSATGDAEYRYPNRRRSIEDLTFDIHQASDEPESLGSSLLLLRITDSYDDQSGAEISPLVELEGFFMRVARTRSRTTDSPRQPTFVPQQIARGGDANKRNVTPEGAAEFLDTRTQVYRTRVGGVGTSVDHSALTRAAHGYSE